VRALRWTAAGLFLIVLVMPARAEAHPLGNFTVNRYAAIELSGAVVRVTYVLDEAEIPTFKNQPAIDADRDTFVERRAQSILSNLDLVIDGTKVPLRVTDRLLTQPEGQGDLRTLRLALTLEAPSPPGGARHFATFADANEPDRVGWREIVLVPRGNSKVANSTVPAEDRSDMLTRYPDDLLQAPLDVRKAAFEFDPGTEIVVAQALTSPTQTATRAGGKFAALVNVDDLGLAAVFSALVLAFGFGAAHALGPGHGKSVMAAYLVGTRGRPQDAVWLGVIVSFMHTSSVLLVGLALLQLDNVTEIERIYPVLAIVSGAVIVAFGLSLALSRGRHLVAARRRHARTQSHAAEHDRARLRGDSHDHRAHGDHSHDDHSHDDHSHDDEQHDHDHDHGNGHGHDHGNEHDHGHEHEVLGHEHGHGPGGHSHDLPADVAPLSRRGLLVLAGSGGVIPSPSAIIVLISAVSLGRIGFGLALIAVFSIGLAATLSAVGLALVYGRRAVATRAGDGRVFRLLPLASACALIILGAFVAARGVLSL